MEIVFENKVVSTYREVFHQLKRVQESAETVVPDTNDDIGRIASVQTSVLLKSKDMTSRGVMISGEAGATLLYITENDNSISFVKLSKSFEMEFELGETEAGMAAQINLNVVNTEARVINPRKVSVTMEITGEMSCYRREEIVVSSSLPESAGAALYTKEETAEAVIINSVCEKTFAVNEQYSFIPGKPSPSQLIFHKIHFCVSETQQIGSKLIIKGSVELEICYASNEVAYPVKTEFSSPFSQIIDTGEEESDGCSVMIELSSAYFELIDTISGEKAVDVELHAVAQVVSRRRRSISYISDAYSNQLPARCETQGFQLGSVSDMMRSKLSADERISIGEDCVDVLSVFPSIAQISAQQEKLSASVALDVLYRTRDGLLSSAKRLMSLEGECLAAPSRIISARLSDVYLRPDGGFIDSHLSLDTLFQSSGSLELNRVSSVTLDEEAPFDLSLFPTVSLVRVENESLWELAKLYHSSTEAIDRMNELENTETDRLLLIPKEL